MDGRRHGTKTYASAATRLAGLPANRRVRRNMPTPPMTYDPSSATCADSSGLSVDQNTGAASGA
jgi:hypothetical protein